MDQFSFLDESVAKEPYIYDVLSEILHFQKEALPPEMRPLATMEVLKRSRNIKIPFTASREGAIEYLLDLLIKNYPDFIRFLVTFDFRVEGETKKLDIIESLEYVITSDSDEYDRMLMVRDNKSAETLVTLLKRYRLFNLSKLISKSRHRTHLMRVIKLELGKDIFTFKNYSLDKNKIEVAEDYCFHGVNYAKVRDSLKLDSLRDILGHYAEPVKRRLKKFGILNTEFSDYRDSKLDYLFSILLEDLAPTMSEKDLIEVKNINSLRACLLKVDKILDPVHTMGDEILKAIREGGLRTVSELSTHPEISLELLEKWATPDNLKKNGILATTCEGETCYIDGSKFIRVLTDLKDLVLFQPEKFADLSFNDRQKAQARLDLLYTMAKRITGGEEAKDLFADPESQASLNRIIEDYEDYRKRQALHQDMEKRVLETVVKESLIQKFFRWIASLFGGKKKKIGRFADDFIPARKEISQETREFYARIGRSGALVIPLSEYIEITPENDARVGRLIKELRDNNLKIVIPIYHAREVLYPRRSQKLLIADMEYLLVPPDTARNSETVREYISTLNGETARDETLPASAIIAIEKYLLTLYRQKRALSLKKK